MKDEKRKPYCKPEIEQVSLVPEEAVLGGCKVDGSVSDGIGGTANCAAAGCTDNGTS